MAYLWILWIGFLAVIVGAQTTTSPAPQKSPSYLISVSQVVRSGVPNAVAITILTESPVLVTCEIIQGNNSLGQTQSTIEGGSTKLQMLPPIPEDDSSYWNPYELTVNGYIANSLVFSNSTMLKYSPRSLSILLQTDKAQYKPGQAVKIRALIITPDGKPCNKQINIIIMDPRENMIHQWLAIDTFLGETDKEFQLSQNPPLGMWKIRATVNEISQDKYFNVSHYVLPKFEVLLDAPDVVHHKENLKITVTAQYHNGKPVSGKMLVMYVHSWYGMTTSHEVWKMIDGETELSYDVSSMFEKSTEYMYSFSEIYPSRDSIDINVQVTEPMTGLTYNSSVRVCIVMHKYKLEFQKYPDAIKPSLNFSGQLKLCTYNHRPLKPEDQKRTVTLTVSQQSLSPWMFKWENPENFEAQDVAYLNGNTSMKTMQLPVPADGVIPFQIELSENVAMLSIQAQFEDVQESLQLYRSYSSPSSSYIQLRCKNPPEIGQSLHMSVESNFPLTEINYMVLSRGQIVAAGKATSSYFSLSPEPSWVPLAKVLVYCVRPDGEIINAVLDVSFTKILRNNVTVSWATEEAEPAENVSLFISVAEPKSLVGILIVDKASQDSDRSNDFTEKRIIEELSTYTSDMTMMDGMDINDPYCVFMTSGITVLTDANLNLGGSYHRPEFSIEMYPMMETQDWSDREFRQRRNFPETWLWLDTTMRNSTTAVFPLTAPDSMTTWVATAFVISENLGLGLSAPAELCVSKDFYLSLNLPKYLVRGELLLLEISLFNYMDMDMEVLVTVEESSMFEFVTLTGEESVLSGLRHVYIWSQNSTTVQFAIRANQLGDMPISVNAMNSYISDSVLRTILVKPEGREQSFTQTLFLEFDQMKMSLSRKVEFYFPATVVPGSMRAQVTAVGDILGPSISGLESLIQMPYGCGEQNMIHFAPNVYVLQYLNKLGQIDDETRTKALKYMTQGYERELSYQRWDGSFSAFGDSDVSGSTWLSAFVLRCFFQARPFIFIDSAILVNTKKWLRAQQMYDGSFAEPGRVIHTELQGGLDGSVSLTAYVLMGLLEDVEYKHSYNTEISDAISFLTSKLNQGIHSNYSLCLVTYALSLAKSPSAAMALTELMNRAQMHDGVPMWSTGGSSVSESWQPRSADIEMASYALLSLYMLGSMEHAINIMKWLSQQRNHLGGYGSTQDTVIALQALSAFASLSTEQIDLSITVKSPTATVATFTIDGDNYLIYQTQEIEAEEHTQLEVLAMGKGFALFQLTTFYNVETQGLLRRRRSDMCESFDLDMDLIDIDMYNLNIHICFRLCENQELNRTGMAILEVGLLTGFGLAQRGVPVNELVRKVETCPEKVILYLDSVTKAKSCVMVPTTLEYKVTDVHDAMVTLYDYYEPRRKAMASYKSDIRRDMPFCLYCGDHCGKLCGDYEYSVFDSDASSYHHLGFLQIVALLLVTIFSLCFQIMSD